MIGSTRMSRDVARRVVTIVCLTLLVTIGMPSGTRAAETTASKDHLRVLVAHRDPARVQILTRMFEGRNDAVVEVVHEATPTVDRIAAGQRRAPFDVLVTNDLALLESVRAAGLMRPLDTPALLDAVPARFRSDGDAWFAVAYRPRVLVARRDRVPEDRLSYDALASPRFKGRVCVRSGLYRYNLETIAAIVAEIGEARTRLWLAGLKANLARAPMGNDRDQLRAMVEGLCDIALVNQYYLHPLPGAAHSAEEADWKADLKVILPEPPGTGAHVNVFGAAAMADAPRADLARRFLTFLATDAQPILALAYAEYPVNPSVAPPPALPPLTASHVRPSVVAAQLEAARALVVAVEFDAGQQH